MPSSSVARAGRLWQGAVIRLLPSRLPAPPSPREPQPCQYEATHIRFSSVAFAPSKLQNRIGGIHRRLVQRGTREASNIGYGAKGTSRLPRKSDPLNRSAIGCLSGRDKAMLCISRRCDTGCVARNEASAWNERRVCKSLQIGALAASPRAAEPQTWILPCGAVGTLPPKKSLMTSPTSASMASRSSGASSGWAREARILTSVLSHFLTGSAGGLHQLRILDINQKECAHRRVLRPFCFRDPIGNSDRLFCRCVGPSSWEYSGPHRTRFEIVSGR